MRQTRLLQSFEQRGRCLGDKTSELAFEKHIDRQTRQLRLQAGGFSLLVDLGFLHIARCCIRADGICQR